MEKQSEVIEFNFDLSDNLYIGVDEPDRIKKIIERLEAREYNTGGTFRITKLFDENNITLHIDSFNGLEIFFMLSGIDIKYLKDFLDSIIKNGFDISE